MYNKKNKSDGERKFHSHKQYQSGQKNNSHHKQMPRKRFRGVFIDPSRFINRATVQTSEDKYVPKNAFSDFPIADAIKKNIASRGFEYPTPIQDKTIGHILAGRDVIGLANTGTGKTGAFLIPLLDKIFKNTQEKLLIIVPTRELATQIQDELEIFAKDIHIKSVVAVGGANIRTQIQKLASRHNVVIGTPGRLKDLIQRKNLNLSSFKNVVLDEADRMLDMGFMPDIKYLLSLLNKTRQTLFFSATLAPEIEKLVKDFLANPVSVSLKTRETSAQVDQDIVRIKNGEDKIEILRVILAKDNFQKVLVFTRTKYGAEKLSRALHSKGFKSESIHGDKSYAKRQKALKLFKDDYVDILVATDVAARGLDIPNVSHVINFDVPATYDDYVHRIGRTGRSGNTGVALTFVE